jgi:hypothetical protein
VLVDGEEDALVVEVASGILVGTELVLLARLFELALVRALEGPGEDDALFAASGGGKGSCSLVQDHPKRREGAEDREWRERENGNQDEPLLLNPGHGLVDVDVVRLDLVVEVALLLLKRSKGSVHRRELVLALDTAVVCLAARESDESRVRERARGRGDLRFD